MAYAAVHAHRIASSKGSGCRSGPPRAARQGRWRPWSHCLLTGRRSSGRWQSTAAATIAAPRGLAPGAQALCHAASNSGPSAMTSASPHRSQLPGVSPVRGSPSCALARRISSGDQWRCDSIRVARCGTSRWTRQASRSGQPALLTGFVTTHLLRPHGRQHDHPPGPPLDRLGRRGRRHSVGARIVLEIVQPQDGTATTARDLDGVGERRPGHGTHERVPREARARDLVRQAGLARGRLADDEDEAVLPHGPTQRGVDVAFDGGRR